MPMFEDHLEDGSPPPSSDKVGPRSSPDMAAPAKPITIPDAAIGVPSLSRRLSEESIRTELCEGPLPDSPDPRPKTPSPESRDASQPCSDRAELIERLKRGESPTWVPNRHLEALVHAATDPLSPSRTTSPKLPSPNASTLLPPADITPEKQSGVRNEAGIEDKEAEERLRDGLNIERPRSALHSGDFTQSESSSSHGDGSDESHRDSVKERPLYSDRNAWIATSPPRHTFDPFTSFSGSGRPSAAYLGAAEDHLSGSSLSSSLSSSFVYKPPTSPLVQSETNDELDLTVPMKGIDITAQGSRNPRRHTVTLQHSPSPLHIPFASSLRHPVSASHRREGSYPYQAHQPRKSLNSITSYNQFLPSSSPQTPFLRSRRPSISSDASSPLHHASMVGSYEESILRGRMSTTPSKPLDFLAQIAVLGLGNKCKASLRCPAHVTLPFPAVFYSYSTTTSHGRSKEDEGPSPYVGQIDLENGLPNSEEEARAKRKVQRRNNSRRPVPSASGADEDVDMDRPIDVDPELSTTESRRSRQKRSSHAPKAPPGGSYRIPEKGQLQIIIKNQNKTAVKLFLIPYDLAGMEPGTKTFIRQRSYSAGPIIDSQPNEAAPAMDQDRPILRYLIHLHICCPSPGRFYLYRSIRVVFANRVPDGKEKLRNELTFPEPRYTAYKPVRVMHPTPLLPHGMSPGGLSATTTGPGAMLAAEKAYRRRSSGFSFAGAVHPSPGGFMDSVLSSPPMPTSVSLSRRPSLQQHTPSALGLSGWATGTPSSFDNVGSSNNFPVEAVPFPLAARRRLESVTSDGAASDETNTTNAATILHNGTASSLSSGSRTNSLISQDQQYNKLSRGDVGYGGNMFQFVGGGGSAGDSRPGSAEGLLSKRLRGLGVKTGQNPEGDGEK